MGRMVDYFSAEGVRRAVEKELDRLLTEREWEAITDIILYEVKGAFYLLNEDLEYDMGRIRKLLRLMV